MSTQPTRRTTLCIIVAMALLSSNVSAREADRPEGASFSIAARTIDLANQCDLHATIATVHVRVHNHGNAPSSPMTIRVLDSAHALAGTSNLPALAAHEHRSIDVSLSLSTGLDPVPAAGPAAIAGAHTFMVYLADSPPHPLRLTTSVAEISATIPAAFCAQTIALAAPATAAPATAAPASTTPANSPNFATTQALAGTQAQVLFGESAPVATAAPANASTSVTARIIPYSLATPFRPDSVIAVRAPIALIVGVPQGLRAASTAVDCRRHLLGSPLLGGPSPCDSMMSSGDLVLVWDPPSDASVDGYRLYALAGIERGAATATFKGRAQTLANLPPVAPGFAPQCYVVTATRGSSESLAGPAFCAHETTSTRTLGTTYARGTWEDHAEQGGLAGSMPGDNVPDGPVVGYYHVKNQSALGDARYTRIHRYAVAFDMDALRNKRLVSARLQLTIASSYGAGNNYSCATSVGSGVEFWWKPDAQSWTEGSFDGSAAPLNNTGPVVTADVTRLVAAIMAGSPNYGFVVRNNDENLGAFTNAQCETVYGNPQLDVVYYDR